MSDSLHASGAVRSERDRTAPWWVKIIVLWHVFCITIWACPKPSDSILNGKVKPPPFAVGDWIRLGDQVHLKSLSAVDLYLFTTGTWQYWDMFSPNPANMDWWGDAEITYKDGTKKMYQFPRMFLLPIPEKYVKERFRKFFERAHDDQYSYLFPVMCQRIALLNYTDPKNPPVKVALRRHWLAISDPGQVQPTEYSWFTYFRGEIDKKMLDKMAGRH